MTVLVVDGNNILSRAIHAAGDKMSSDGVNTGPLVLFANMLSRYLRQYRPDRLGVCWDGGRSTYRLNLYPEYKASREGHEQRKGVDSYALAREFLVHAGIGQHVFEGVEADDLIASFWHGRDPDEDFIILSGDKDFLQLVEGNVCQVRPGVKPEVWWNGVVVDKFGVQPWEIPYLMALSGDTIDGVPGVPRIGHKTARKVWEASQGLWSDVLEHPKVRDHADLARMSLMLVDLRSIDVRGLDGVQKFTVPDPAALLGFLRSYKLDSLVQRIEDGSFWPSD